MENAVERIGFDPRELWIALGTLIALGAVSLLVILLMILCTILAPVLTPYGETDMDLLNRLQPRLPRLSNRWQRQSPPWRRGRTSATC